MMNKKTTCGILVRSGDRYLICRSTNTNVYGIPKGCQEVGEDPVSTAIRETHEETGIWFDKKQLTLFHKYDTPKKHVIVYIADSQLIPVHKLKCTTLIEDTNIPEVDYYLWSTREEALKLVRNHMSVIFKKL